jgi:hypothetical protein
MKVLMDSPVFPFFVVIIVVGMVLYHLFYSKLKSLYPDTWEELGGPRLFQAKGLAGLKVMLFLIKGRHREYQDRNFVALGDAILVYDVCLVVFVVIGGVLAGK